MAQLPGRDLREAAQGPLALRLPSRYLEEHGVLPLGVEPDGAVALAAGGALDPTVTDELARLFARPVRVVEAPAAEIRAALLAARREPGPSREGNVEAAAGGAVLAGPADDEASGVADLRAGPEDAPVVTLVHVLIADALRAGASDVHVETEADGLRVRFRLDGVLTEVSRPPRAYGAAVVSRLKLMAGLDIAERRRPQDGRLRLREGGREVDLRVSTLPALHGESVVLRLLAAEGAARDLDALGMTGPAADGFRRLCRATGGLVLVTGPTGAGKTTTLYAALQAVNTPGVKVVTVEDPVEYRIPGVVQVPVQRKAGVGFATALRSILRHDPDVVMVGEMRDVETAEMAIQAALTGHLVFSTLHTTDAAGGVTRLVDMGVAPYLVAATVQGILAQRLVRTPCRSCARPADRATIPDALAGELVAVGCAECAGTGYRGRTGLYELLPMTEPLRRLVVERASLDALRAAARAAGMRTLREDGMTKVAQGLTTRAEVLRVSTEVDER